MFDLVLNTSFICTANQLTSFYLIRIFTEKFLTNKGIKIWILIIQRNMFKLHAKKIYTKYDKVCVFEKKILTKIIIVKRNLEFNDLGFLCYSAKTCWLVRVYIGPFFSLYITLPWYHQNGKLVEKLIFETFAGCSQINFPHYFWHFGTPFSNGKNETKWQGT